MRPKQRKVAAKNMLELRTAEVDADSVGSDTSLSAACRYVATPEIRSLPGWIFEGTHSPEERDAVWGGATRWRSFWDTILELLPRCRATLPRLGRQAQFATLSCFADEEAGQRLGKLHTHSPTSIQKRQSRKRSYSVTVILAQWENPLIEISAILTQCDRPLNMAKPSVPAFGPARDAVERLNSWMHRSRQCRYR